MRTVYKVMIATGALLLLSLGYQIFGRERNPTHQRPTYRTETLKISIEGPNVHLEPPLSIDEECFGRNVKIYLKEMNSPLLSFGANDGRTEGFQIPEPQKYGAQFVEAAKKCQK